MKKLGDILTTYYVAAIDKNLQNCIYLQQSYNLDRVKKFKISKVPVWKADFNVTAETVEKVQKREYQQFRML